MITSQELGVIERVDLRDVWKNEAKNFTPWLAKNISKLGESLGMELEVEEIEAPVGTFALDILVRDVESGRIVIIENQLELTDHDHLGKLITYAAGCEAGIIVWITEQFKEEHRQALDWLNHRSDDNTEFFGIQIELWKIGNSQPAPHLNLIVTPNEWQRETKRSLPGRKITAKDKKYQVFFQKLLDNLTEIDFCNARTAQPSFQCVFSSGFGAMFRYKAGFTRTGNARVELYIDSGEKSRNKSIFDHISRSEDEIESLFGESLSWERLDKKRASRIATIRDGNIDDEDSKLDDILRWMEEKLVAFKANFKNVLEEEFELDEDDDTDTH